MEEKTIQIAGSITVDELSFTHAKDRKVNLELEKFLKEKYDNFDYCCHFKKGVVFVEDENGNITYDEKYKFSLLADTEENLSDEKVKEYKTKVFSNYKVEYLHGKMKQKEKDDNYTATPRIWQELIRTRKALDVALCSLQDIAESNGDFITGASTPLDEHEYADMMLKEIKRQMK